MPIWQIICGFIPRIDVPLSFTSPPSDFRNPAIIAKSVVLPAPFGPISDTISP